MKRKVLLISQESILAAMNGATQMFYYMANQLSQRGYDVVAAYPNINNPVSDERLCSQVKFYNLNYVDTSGFQSKRKRVSIKDRFVRKRCQSIIDLLKIDNLSDKIEQVIEWEKPDVIIPFFMHVTCQLVFEKNYEIPIIQMHHTHPSMYYSAVKNPKEETLMGQLFKHCVKKADYLQVFFKSYEDYVKKLFNNKTVVIHNPVAKPETHSNPHEEKKKIVYLSRIDKNKGQRILVDAFSIIAKLYPDWEVLLYGDAEPKEYAKILQGHICNLGLENQIKLMGVTNQVEEVYRNADIGAYTSYYEGFPLGLSQALGTGLPCIGLNCASGVNELIKNEYNGLLAEKEPEDIAMKLVRLMDNKELRIEYSENAIKSMAMYSEETFWQKWEDVIEEAIKQKRKPLWRF